MMARVDLTDEAVKTLLIIGGDPASIAVSKPSIVITLEGIHVQPREIPPDQGHGLLRELRTDACQLAGDSTLLPPLSFRGGGRPVALGDRVSLADHAYGRLAVSGLEPEIEIRDIASADDRQHLEFEAAIRAFGPGFLEQSRHCDGKPVGTGGSGMLAGNPIEPSLAPARDREIGRVDGEQPAIHQDALIEPVGDGQGHAKALPGPVVDQVGPAFDPAELPLLLAALRPDVGLDRGCLQTAKRVAQQLVVAAAYVTTDRLEQIVCLKM